MNRRGFLRFLGIAPVAVPAAVIASAPAVSITASEACARACADTELAGTLARLRAPQACQGSLRAYSDLIERLIATPDSEI